MNLTCTHSLYLFSFVNHMQMIPSCYCIKKKSYVPVFLIELSVFKLWVLVHQQSMTNIGQCIYFHTFTCHYCCCWGIAYMYITFAVCLNLLVEWLRLILFYYRLWSKSNGHRTCSCFKSCLKICRKEYWRHGYCWGI